MTHPTRARYSPKGPVGAHPSAFDLEFGVRDPGAKSFEEAGEYAIVDISGPLEQKAGWFCDSYDAIRGRMTEACASSCKAVVLRINSPGGDFAGSIELATELRAMAAHAGKRLVSFTDSQALSAGYILACAADEIVITPTAFVGSIGVWAPMVDQTAQDRAMGLNVVIVASGTRKADSNPHVAVTDDAVAAMQAQVDSMAAMFFAHVSDTRPMAKAAIVGLQGAQKFGTEAISLRLADRIVNSWGLFLTSSTEASAMAKSYGDHMAAHRANLEKCAEGDDEDAKAAQRDLKAWDEKEAAAKAADEEDEKKKEAAKAGDGDGDDDDAKAAAGAKAEFPPKKDEDDKKAAARAKGPRLVASSTPAEVALAERMHALECKIAEGEEATERASLLAGRPDFSAQVRKVLANAPIATLRAAVKDFPRGSIPTKAEAAAFTPGGTRGDTQGSTDDGPLDRNGMPKGFVGKSEESFIDGAMNLGEAKSEGVVRNGRELTLGFMTPDEARAHFKSLSTKGNVK